MKAFFDPGCAGVLYGSGKPGGFCRRYVLPVLLGLSLISRAHAVDVGLQLREISFPRQFKDRNIKQAVYDSKGLVWFFTSRDVYRFDGSNVVALGPEFGIQPYSIQFIHCDRDDRLWIGTRHVLIRLDLKTWKHHAFKFPVNERDRGEAGPSGFVMQTKAGRISCGGLG